MHSQLRLDISKDTLQRIVGIGYVQFRIIIECPQSWHIALQAQIGTSQSFVRIICFTRMAV